MKFGTHVRANFGSGVELGHIVKGPYDNDAGEQKYGILGPDGTVHEMAYTKSDDTPPGGYFTDAD